MKGLPELGPGLGFCHLSLDGLAPVVGLSVEARLLQPV